MIWEYWNNVLSIMQKRVFWKFYKEQIETPDVKITKLKVDNSFKRSVFQAPKILKNSARKNNGLINYFKCTKFEN